jgi:hypothetical protein
MTSVAYAAGPAGYLVAGQLVEAFGRRGAYLVMAWTLLAVVLVVMPTRALRELDAPEPCPPAPSGPSRFRDFHRARRPGGHLSVCAPPRTRTA